jgi:hypothetical protein
MSLDGLKEYCDDYGHSSDDDGSDAVPNSGADDDAPHEDGPDSGEERGPKKLRISSLCSPAYGNASDSSSLHTPAQKSKRAQPFTPPRSGKNYEIPSSDSETRTETNYFLILHGGASAASSVFTPNGKRLRLGLHSI